MRRTARPRTAIEPGAQTGLVLSARGRRVTVLGAGGRVLKLRLPFAGARPGDEVLLPVRAPEAFWVPTAARGLRWAGAVASVLALAVLVASVTMYFAPLPAVAMVSVDINPSVHIYVNSVLRVVSAQAADEAGEALLEDLAPVRQPLGEFLLRLAGRAAPAIAGLDGVRWLIIGATPLSDTEVLSETFLSRLEEARRAAALELARAVGRQPEALVSAVIAVPPAVAAAARESGVTPGQYAVLLTAQDAGADVRVSDARGAGLLQAVSAAGLSPGEILSRAAKAKDLVEIWKRHGSRAEAARPAGPDGSGSDAPPAGGASTAPKPPAASDPAKPQGGPQPGAGAATVPPGQSAAPEPGASTGKSSGAFPIVKGRGPDEAKQRAVEVIERIRQLLGAGGVGRATDKAGKDR